VFSRRWVLAEISAAAALLVGFLYLPEESEADVVHKRLMLLLQGGRLPEAETLAQRASEAGIALSPDTLVLTSKLKVDPSKPIPRIDEAGESTGAGQLARRVAPVNLLTGETLYISVPTLYFPPGRYRIGGTIGGFRVSVLGDGPDRISVFRPATSPEFPGYNGPLLRYWSGAPDVVIAGIEFDGPQDESPVSTTFLEISPGAERTAVVNVYISKMVQPLGRAIWINDRFYDCRIECGEGDFKLHNVIFVRCTFVFEEAFPDDLKRQLETTQGYPVSMHFQR
jgi:hypothetical protein